MSGHATTLVLTWLVSKLGSPNMTNQTLVIQLPMIKSKRTISNIVSRITILFNFYRRFKLQDFWNPKGFITFVLLPTKQASAVTWIPSNYGLFWVESNRNKILETCDFRIGQVRFQSLEFKHLSINVNNYCGNNTIWPLST